MSIVDALGGVPGKQTISELVAGLGKQKNYILGPGTFTGQEETIDDAKVYVDSLPLIFNKELGTVLHLFETVPYVLEFDGNAFEINSQSDFAAFVVYSGAKISEYDFSIRPFAIYPMREEGPSGPASAIVDFLILVADDNPHTFGLYKMESGSESKEEVVVVEVSVKYGENPTASLMNYSFMEVYSMLKAKDGPIVAFREFYDNGDSAGTTTLIAEAVAGKSRQYIYIEFFEPHYYDHLGVERITFSNDGTANKVESFDIAYVTESGDGA